MRNPRACGSLAQHSGVFVLIFLYGSMFWLMLLSRMETENSFGGSTTEANKITVQAIPKPMLSARDKTGRKFHRQWPMTGARDILTKLLLVRRENTNAAPPAQNVHIFLCGTFSCGWRTDSLRAFSTDVASARFLVPVLSCFRVSGFGVLDVEYAATFATAEDVTTFHSSDFWSEAMRLNADLAVSATPNGGRIPSSRVIAEFYRSNG